MADEVRAVATPDMASLKRRYMLDIDLYERTYGEWRSRGKKIIERYRDERNKDSDGDSAQYNILWSNVQTILPAVFARLPKPEVTRRYKDKDPIGRVASEILERALSYEIEQYDDYEDAVHNSVEDRLLPGRGVAWVRYEPKMKAEQLPEDVQITEDVEDEGPQTVDVIDYECSPVDYVNWEDFGHNVARTWKEVFVVWRIVPLTRAELIKRFGKEKGSKIPLDMKSQLEEADTTTPEGESLKKARIYEVWDKKTGKVTWLSKAYEEAIEQRDDTLQLDGFFPCPKPLYATITTGSLIPVPDYAQYQDQAKELDILCERIDGLIKALKVVGVYDSTQTGVQRMLTEGANNTLIPVENWMVFGEKGGLKGVVEFMPLDMVVAALNAAYLAREQVKAVIYEVTGISDILRGASDPNETLGAQQIKSNFGSMRLKKLQGAVAVFATTLLRIKAQIICQHYQPESIKLMAGVEQMPEEDKPLVDQAIALLRNDPMRCFRIDISSDSLLEVDEQQEKQDRMEFLTAVGGFIKEAIQAPPELQPLLGECLLFGIRGFKAGRSLEGAFDEMMESLRQKAKQPQPPPPDPAMEKIKADQQAAQAKMQMEGQLEQMRTQAEQQREQMRLSMEAQAAAQQMALEQQLEERRMQMEAVMNERQAQLDMTFQKWKAELDAATKIEAANIASKAKVQDAATDAATNEIASEVKQ
jgi:hypothetical protein